MEDEKILDEFGREFLLLDVVSEALRYLNDNLIADLKLRQDIFEENDVLRVITVPAIWSDSARNFMKKAAVKVRPTHIQIVKKLCSHQYSYACFLSQFLY